MSPVNLVFCWDGEVRWWGLWMQGNKQQIASIISCFHLMWLMFSTYLWGASCIALFCLATPSLGRSVSFRLFVVEGEWLWCFLLVFSLIFSFYLILLFCGSFFFLDPIMSIFIEWENSYIISVWGYHYYYYLCGYRTSTLYRRYFVFYCAVLDVASELHIFS